MNTAVIELVNLLKGRAVVFKDDVLADSFESLNADYGHKVSDVISCLVFSVCAV